MKPIVDQDHAMMVTIALVHRSFGPSVSSQLLELTGPLSMADAPISLRGLAADWEGCCSIRHSARANGRLIQWPNPEAVGIPSMSLVKVFDLLVLTILGLGIGIHSHSLHRYVEML